MLCFLLSLILSSQVTTLPENDIPNIVESPCDVAERECEEAFKSAQCTADTLQNANWQIFSKVLQKQARDLVVKGVHIGQIGYYYTSIANTQLVLENDEAATKSYQMAAKYFIQADETFMEALEILTPPKKDI
jgi:hypothetical protein